MFRCWCGARRGRRGPVIAMLDDGQTAELAEVFHLLGDATRLRIVLACLAGPVSVSALAERTCGRIDFSRPW